MTKFEILTTILSCIAIVTSLTVWIGQRKLQREANDLQRKTAELAAKQLELIEREEKLKDETRLSLTLYRDGTCRIPDDHMDA